MAENPMRFDDSLPRLANTLATELGEQALSAGLVLRDAVGRLAFFAATPLDEGTVERLSTKLRQELGVYARTDRVVAGANEFGVAELFGEPSMRSITVAGRRIRFVDRRLVGADWLRMPAPPASGPSRVVFASLKGGVGRSTALSVVAAHLSAHGRRVLAVDLDLEAPGLGAVLLNAETLPQFGMIDALVENKLSTLDERFFVDLVGPSGLADNRGRIDVIPAFGSRSIKNPGDVLAKLARAYAENVRPDGTVSTILDQVRSVIDHFADSAVYDVILLDARAGLHETTAAAVLGMGAEVLLFGLDEEQTFQGYAALFAHLAQFLPPEGVSPEWIERLTMVQGRAPVDAEGRAEFGQRCLDLFRMTGLDRYPTEKAGIVQFPAEPFKDVPWDDSASDDEVLPHEGSLREPLAVLDDPRFARFDPRKSRDLLSEAVYRTSFQSLTDRIDTVLKSAEANS